MPAHVRELLASAMAGALTILQSTFRGVARDYASVKMWDKEDRALEISSADWEELGRPETVSVTIMKPMVRTGAPAQEDLGKAEQAWPDHGRHHQKGNAQ